MKTAEKFANGFFPHGYPELDEQWIDCIEATMQAQHAETWAMAIEAGDGVADRLWREHRTIIAQKIINAYRVAIRALPCPPLDMGE